MGRMERKPELRLPTVAVPVKLALVGHEAAAAELFVADAVRPGRSQLHNDIASDARRARELSAGARRFERSAVREGVDCVGLHGASARKPSAARPSSSTSHPKWSRSTIGGTMSSSSWIGGGSLVGTLFDSSPSDRPRVIDHFNRAGGS